MQYLKMNECSSTSMSWCVNIERARKSSISKYSPRRVYEIYMPALSTLPDTKTVLKLYKPLQSCDVTFRLFSVPFLHSSHYRPVGIQNVFIKFEGNFLKLEVRWKHKFSGRFMAANLIFFTWHQRLYFSNTNCKIV